MLPDVISCTLGASSSVIVQYQPQDSSNIADVVIVSGGPMVQVLDQVLVSLRQFEMNLYCAGNAGVPVPLLVSVTDTQGRLFEGVIHVNVE